MQIAGKSLQQLMDELPAGKFAALARQEVDPLWGLIRPDEEVNTYSVCYSYTIRGSGTIEIEAPNEEVARDLANQQLDDLSDGEGWDDCDIDSLKELR